MKIVHVCLACFYVEGFGYQENILPKVHSEMGLDVTVLTSDYAFNQKHEKIKKKSSDYVNKYGVHVKVLKSTSRYGYFSRFGDYPSLAVELESIKPDIIFVHGGQFISLNAVVSYCKKHRSTKLYIDQHADYYNTPVNTIRQKIKSKFIYGYGMRRAVKFCNKFWGVTPWRCQYLNDIYSIPNNKIDLLVMGGDDDYINYDQKDEISFNIRKKLELEQDDFVIITGGKIDAAKNIDILMNVVSNLSIDKIKLIVFGQPVESMVDKINQLANNDHIRYIGWLESYKVYDYFLASDLGFFPGTHSVLWEQACACGLPCVFKDWEGMHHVDVGGNCSFIKNIDKNVINESILSIYNNRKEYLKMKKIAETKGKEEFSYKQIAKKSIEL